MKSLIVLSFATGVLVAGLAAAPCYAVELQRGSGPSRRGPVERTPEPPVVRDRDRAGAEDRRYRPPVVLLPKGRSTKAYDRYVEREFKRDPDGGYRGWRRNRPRSGW